MGESKGKSVGMTPIVALVLSEVWMVLGYVGNLYGAMTTVGYSIVFLAFVGTVTAVNLVLIPFVVRETKWAYLVATIVAIAVFLVILTLGPVYQLATMGWQNTTDFALAVGGGIMWLILQVPVIYFSLKAYRKL